MSNIDALLEGLIESQVDTLVQDDAYYQTFATPLKPASSFKKAHREQLVDFFKLTELRNQLENAPHLIFNLLPQYVSTVDFNQIKQEFDNSGAHFVQFLETIQKEPQKEAQSDQPISFQQMFGLSDETMIHIYELGKESVMTNPENSLTLFIFLTTMAPHVESYWIAQGACLQLLNRHEEAVEVFKIAKFLNPSDPAPSVYMIESYYALKSLDEAKLELSALEEICKFLPEEKRLQWKEKIKSLMNSKEEK